MDSEKSKQTQTESSRGRKRARETDATKASEASAGTLGSVVHTQVESKKSKQAQTASSRARKSARETNATKASKKTPFWKNKPKDPRYMWSEKMPLAKLYQTNSKEEALGKGSAKKYFLDPNFEDYCSEKISIVLDPRDQKMVYYKDVDAVEIRKMHLLDGYCWRFKAPYQDRTNEIWMYFSFAELEIAGCYHRVFKKYHAYHKPTRRMVTLYVGDHRYGLRHPFTSINVPEDMRPPKDNWKIHPDYLLGSTKAHQIAKYTAIYNQAEKKSSPSNEAVKEQRRVLTFVASTPLRQLGAENDQPLVVDHTQQEQHHLGNFGTDIASTPLGQLAAEIDQPSVVDQASHVQTAAEHHLVKFGTYQASTSQGQHAAEIDQPSVAHQTWHEPQTTQDDLCNAGLVTASAVPANKFRRANGHKVKLDWRIQLKDILALKEEADRIQDCWESVFYTEIFNPLPDEVYFRDYKVLREEETTFHFEEKEAKDGYSWIKQTFGFLINKWFIYKVIYVNQDSLNNTLNLAWSKTIYIFPKEDKMIIHYTGSNENAH